MKAKEENWVGRLNGLDFYFQRIFFKKGGCPIRAASFFLVGIQFGPEFKRHFSKSDNLSKSFG
jgi:hypothetical protein